MRTFHGTLLGIAALILLSTGLGVVSEAGELSPEPHPGVPLTHDFLVLTGGFNRVASSGDGGITSLDWVHLTRSGKTYTAGAEAHSVGDSRWAFLTFGSTLLKMDRFQLQIRGSFGGGNADGENFSYQSYEATVSYKTTQQFYLTLDEQYLKIGDAHGLLIKPGTTIFIRPWLRAELSFSQSVGGNVQTQLGSGRLDVDARAVGLFGGIAGGHTSPEIVRVEFGSETPGQSLKEAYLGFRLRLREIEWTVVADFPDLATNRQQIITVGLKLPLRRNRRDSQ